MANKPTYKELEQRIHELEEENSACKGVDEELINAYNTTQNIIEKAPFGIYVVNEEGYIDYVNPAMTKIAGDYYEEFKNLNVFNLPTYQNIGLSKKIKAGLEGEYFSMAGIKYTSYYGQRTTIRNFIGIPLKEGYIRKLVMIVEDITEVKQVEEELDKHRRHLQDLVEEVVKEHTIILTETNDQLRQEITEHKKTEQRIIISSEKLRDLFSHLQSVRDEKKSRLTREIHNQLERLISAVQTALSD